MSTEVIILCVGIVLILLAILGRSIEKKKDVALISSKTGIVLGVLGVLMVIYVGFSSEVSYSNSRIEQVSEGNKLEIKGPVSAVKVISPVEGDSVDCRVLSMGVYPENHTKDIWVLLKPTDERYYPQSDHTNTSYKRDGEWQVVTRFGGDLGEAYDLIVYETDSAASRFFTQTIEEWKTANDFPGLLESEIPAGAQKVDEITIYLGKNCRGVF